MNLEQSHDQEKEVSANPIFKGEVGVTIAIQLQRHGTLKEHITKTPALLICVSGYVTYEDENDLEVNLEPGDFIEIKPSVKHWLSAGVKSQLILCK